MKLSANSSHVSPQQFYGVVFPAAHHLECKTQRFSLPSR